MLTVERGEKIKQNRKQYTSVERKVITSHSLSHPRWRDQHVLLSLLKKRQGGYLSPQFPQNRLPSGLTPSAPRGSSTFPSCGVLS